MKMRQAIMLVRPMTAASAAMIFAVVAGAQAPSPVKAFVGATIVDGTPTTIPKAALLVRNGRVEAVGPASTVRVPDGAERIDLSGLTVTPGLVNAHGHVGAAIGLKGGPEAGSEQNVLNQLGVYARYGLTTIFSLGGEGAAAIQIRDAQAVPTLNRARLFLAGDVVTANTPEEARTKVRELARLKVDVVKIRVDDNLGASVKMPPAIYQAVIDEAHKSGLKVAAHLYYLDDAKGLLRAGADFVAHSIRDRPVDQELIDLMKQRGVCLCPTLTREVSVFVYETVPDFFSDPFFSREVDPSVIEQLKDPKRQESIRNDKRAQVYKEALKMASRNLKALHDAGIRIAMGTDSGMPARFQGYFEHMEMTLMAEAGLPAAAVLQAATVNPSRCFGMSEPIGALVPGAWADFVALRREPADRHRQSARDRIGLDCRKSRAGQVNRRTALAGMRARRPAALGRHLSTEFDREDRTTVGPRAFRFHTSAVELHHGPNDRQPQPESAMRACAAAVGLAESIEDVRKKIGLDADAGVRNAQPRHVGICFDRDTNGTPGRRELDGVREEIPDRLLQAVGIAEDADLLDTQHAREADPLGLRPRAQVLDDVFRDQAQVDPSRLDSQLTRRRCATHRADPR